MPSIDQLLSKSVFYNTTLFDVYFVFVIFVAAMRFVDSFRQAKVVFKKAIVVGVVHQYFFLPMFAFLFTWILQTSVEVTLAIFLLVSFCNSRFSLLITWIAGGCTLYAVALALISIIFSLTITPYLFYLLMHTSPITQAIAVDYTYSEFISLIFKERIDFFWLIVPTVLLGMLVGHYYSLAGDLIESKLSWLAFMFAVCVSFIVIGQRPEYFTDYWHFFSWKLLIYDVSIFVFSYWIGTQFGFTKKLSLALMISSGKHFIPITLILLTHWYPNSLETDWLLYTQVVATQWLFLILVFYLRYQIQYEKRA